MFGGIETGGTKTVCAVGADGAVEHRAQFPTGEDADALADRCAEFFAAHPVRSIGVGTFGPCDPDPGSATYGHILNTPKPGWSGVDLLGKLAARVDAPMVLTTDVTAAAIGEQRYGAGRGNQNLVYLTIGTGVGGGAIVDGRVLHGRTHPEMGHILMPDIATGGVCPYHGDCFEGLASGPAMAAREGRPAQEIPDDDPAWDPGVSDRRCGSALHHLHTQLLSRCIIVGGGLGSRSALHTLPRNHQPLTGRLRACTIKLAAPGLGADAGVIEHRRWRRITARVDATRPSARSSPRLRQAPTWPWA